LNTTTFLNAERSTDSRGRDCWRAALTGQDGQGLFALLDDAGLAALHDAGVRRLYLVSDHRGGSYVYAVPFPSHRATGAARIITRNPRGQRVEFISGDRLDLRGSNLRVRQYEGIGEPGHRQPRAKKAVEAA
jgi:hypothetical protein